MKLKSLLLASAFVVAIASAFAFKSRPLNSSYASLKVGTASCNNATGSVACDGGELDCTISGTSYFSDQNCVTVLKKNN